MFSQYSPSMVGEQGNRTAGTRSATPPQSYWWKRIQNSNTRSRLQEISGSLNCAEKFTSLVSCHRGYGSVAFYAVFSLFILTFLYAIWKIVSAHSRSGRRPGSGNSTSVAKLSPTAQAPTTYINTYAWLHKENILTHFNPSLKGSYSPLDNPTPVNLYPPDRQKHSKIPSLIDKDFPTRGHAILENTSPTWTSPNRATEPLYNYYSGPYKTIQPPLNNPPPYPTLPYPSVVNPLFPSAQYPQGFNPYPRPPLLSDLNIDRRFRFEYGIPTSSPFNYNSNSPGILNERTSIMPPVVNTSNIPADYALPVDKNALSQGYYDNNYYRVDRLQIEGALPTSPSPLISFLKETSQNNHNSRPKARKKRKRITPKRKTRRHKRKKQSQIQNHVKNVKDFEENLKNRQAKHHVTLIRSHRKKSQEKWRKGRKPHLRQYKRMRHFRAHFESARSRIPRYHRKVIHIKKSFEVKNSKTRYHDKPRTHLHRIYDHHRKKAHIHHTYSRRHHRVLNFRLYRLYRRHHSVHDEIRGKWRVSRHRVRTCKIVDQFSTRGLVKITRTKRKSRYFHTLLICRPVRLKMKKGVHRHSYPVKYAQLCHKKWFITKGFIFVNRVSKRQEFPIYSVKVCTPSYAHANQLLSAKNEESKVWNISKEVLLKMKTEDTENLNARTSSVTDGHKHHTRKKKVKKHRKRLKRKNLHGKKRRKHLKHQTKAGKRLKLHEKERRKLEKVQKKQKVHHRLSPNKASKRKKTFGKTKGKYMDPEHDFYGKLLHIIKLAKIYDKKKPANGTKDEDVFDLLEAVLEKNQTTTNVPLGKKKPTVKPRTMKTVTTPSRHHLSHQNSQNSSTRDSKVHSQDNVHLTHENSQNSSKNDKGDNQDNIQRLLAKILPAVIKNLHGDAAVSHLTKTKITTKPTVKITTIQKTTPTTQVTISTTKSSKDHFEELMKTFLPLLLKKTQSIKGVKQNPEKKQAPVQPKQSPSLPRKVTTKIDLKTLLSRMGVNNLESESLYNKILAKTATVTAKPTTKPTSKLFMSPEKSTVVPKTSIHPPITRPKPTSPVTTIQLPPQLSQPDVSHQLESPMDANPSFLQTKKPVSLPQMPFVSLSAPPATPSYILPPVPATALFSPRSPPELSSQPAFSPQVNGDNTSPVLPLVNSDPYSRSILCFGDSLTSGFYNHGKNFHPYSKKLSQLLSSDSRRLRYYIKTSGKVREMAHGSMARRLPQILGNSSRFDWVIILGGTNDVAHVKNFGDDDSFMNQLINVWKPRIVRDIEVLHETAHKYGARTVLLTIPETAYEAWPNFKTLWIMRRGINQDLREFARRSQGNTVLCDLALKLPRHSISPQAQAILWNDHLHLTPYGYDKMAEIIYQCLKPYLSN